MITHRNATQSELCEVLDWAAAEGWNPGLDDAAAFYRADPKGFFVAVDGADRPVAAISVVNHNDSFAFLGLYIVRPEHRGKGIGLALWQRALRHAGNRTIGLDGVAAQQDNYASVGFVHAGGTTRFTGMVNGAPDAGIRLATAGDIPAMILQETAASGTAKYRYLGMWFELTAHRSSLVREGARGIDGFCTLRTCREGVKIGPLVAEDPDIAARLIAHAASLADGPLTLDVPGGSTQLRAVCDGFQMAAGFETTRMYRGPFQTGEHPCFAVASLELG